MSNDNKNADGIKNTCKKERPLWLVRSFGTRRVFVAYLICTFITIVSMVISIITSILPELLMRMFPNLLDILVRFFPTMTPEAPTISFEKMIEHVALCVFGLLFMAIPLVMHRKYDFRWPPFIQIIIAIIIFSHFVLGEIYRFYDYNMGFDKILHVMGGIIIAMCGFSIVNGLNKTDDGPIRLSPFFTGLFSFCFAVTLLVLWEFFEYGVDTLGGFNMQRWMDSLRILTVSTGEVSDFRMLRSLSGNHRIVLESCCGIGDTLDFALRHWQNTPDSTRFLVTNRAQSSGLIDTMDDVMVGAIGALAVSIIGALSLKKNPDNKKYLITREKTNVQ